MSSNSSSSSSNDVFEDTVEESGLQIINGLVVCADQELRPYCTHPDHLEILKDNGLDVAVRDPAAFPKPFQGKYDLRIIESLLV
jgi:hypothetical protein